MKLIELKCKNCGAILKVKSDSIDIHCEHCQANYKFDDEVQHIKYDDMEQAGYEYEKGRIRAREEHRVIKQQQKARSRAIDNFVSAASNAAGRSVMNKFLKGLFK